MDRDELLALEDDELLRHCRCDTFRASGPGGQHRNTSDSAVRLTLEDTEVTAIASEERSQHRNRARAVKRLRLQIALNLRRDPAPSWDGPWKPGARDRQYAEFVAHVFDALAATEYRVSDAAKLLEVSTGRLVRTLAADTTLWARVNQEREKRDMKPLKMDK
ncbi:MAG: peptide chain release factor-like protein [Lentisphaeria bacterium]|jgi:protein subunit release factor B|nr:peptide chain release factor-like protein [Lentisphaeria bacterium]